MTLTPLSDLDGSAVDWWFIYKLPHATEVRKGDTETESEGAASGGGYDYLYYDPGSEDGLRLSPNRLSGGDDALARTLGQLASAAGAGAGGNAGAEDSSLCWYIYNDEIPGTSHNDEDKGHTKGVVAFDMAAGSGFWLLHSTPRFPVAGHAGFPADEKIYGQTFLCVSFSDYGTLNDIAGMMRQYHVPQIYGFNLPATVSITDDVYGLCHGEEPDEAPASGKIQFTSAAGKSFTCIAKDRRWGRDFWTDLVGPTLGVDLDIESWRRGAVPSDEDSRAGLDVADMSGVDLAALGLDLAWPYTRDHAKWAVSNDPSWVCVADLNRQVSQERRGGGALCFQEQRLWQDLASIDTLPSSGTA
ncbi:deoxyribonuclease II family protein [Kordiimonas marina]|uniref:deoxyribonuclease II family protein n=1 Tax=Kordiimonas marina TaxID=2872312 RepID=UPI001FF57E9A|nr:deoxyribonuclease II family protein [Kordiimonas marina]MCJ9429365.1 deoxyribonuclease II family protein [Kordiimonas marina]